MNIKFLFLSLVFFAFSKAQNQYWVSFTDKNKSEFSLENPADFLSEKALARRTFFNIPIQQSDLPINKAYISAIENLDAEKEKHSKWLNGILVRSANPNFLAQAKSLAFVKSITPIKVKDSKARQKKERLKTAKVKDELIAEDYGFAWDNIAIIKGDFLHNLGYQGSTIDIGVMDNGFHNVNINPYFDTLNTLGKIQSAYDFVNDDANVFSDGEHGAFVMSTLAAYKKDTLIGTAPFANYFLFATEDENAEGIPEELNWAMAAEWADSALGTWIVLSTSLGYSNGFDDPNTNYTYADMDGNTTIITRAADLAAQKGMLVVNSAGNEGTTPWFHITAPADGDSVLAIGAIVDDLGMAEFSSYGPSADGRTKPNVSALGQGVIAVNPYNELRSISGTSFSCPIVAGMAACLWEAFPQKNNMEILAAIEQSAHLYYGPDIHFGYGIPNFEAAYKILSTQNDNEEQLAIKVYPNPVNEGLNILFLNEETGAYTLKIADASGTVFYEMKDEVKSYNKQINLSNLSQGVYYIMIQQGKKVYREKLIKQ